MESNQRIALLCTSERSIRHWRGFYWVVHAIFLPIFAAIVFWSFGEFTITKALLCMAVALVPALGVIYLNSVRSVIGVRLYEDDIVLITPLSERSFDWQQVRVKYQILSIEIRTLRAIFPYSYLPLRREGREAMGIIRSHAAKSYWL